MHNEIRPLWTKSIIMFSLTISGLNIFCTEAKCIYVTNKQTSHRPRMLTLPKCLKMYSENHFIIVDGVI